MNLIQTLIEDHQRLLILAEALEGILSKSPDFSNSADLEELRERLQQLMELLSSHAERERNGLFPLLRDRLPKTDYWRMGMTESQDEMLLSEVRQLHDLISSLPSTVSADQIKNSAARSVPWLREHIRIEEEELFPKLHDRPDGPTGALSDDLASGKKINLWGRLKTFFNRS